jgi:DNA-binding helix-hairpin-helix protein with protein kinase domain
MQLKRASNAAPIMLGEELGSGGEGTVYRIVDSPDFVAKIYFAPPDTGKVAKLSAMVRAAPPELLRIAAWPTELLLDENDAVRGFLMQRVSSREDAHELYSPKSRRRSFPDADFRFIVHAAANVARAFAQLHAQGHVIGDVNHGNALIGRDATVVLIDCDSFQVKDGESHFTCGVGVPLFTPPELQGQSFRGLVRSADHDAFGLAVLLFHFLYVGRHPFAGRYADGEMPIEQAIAESRFAYGVSAASRGMSAPPGTLALDAFGAPIAAMFERAFAALGTAARPTAVEWVDALNVLEADLTTCATSADHNHPKAAACCWCELESRAYIVLFGRAARRADAFFDHAELDQLWAKITAVASPPAYTPDHERQAEIMASNQIKSSGSGWRGVWWLGCLFFGWLTATMFGDGQAAAWLFLLILIGAILFGVFVIGESPNRQTLEVLLRDTKARLSNEKFMSVQEQLGKARHRLAAIHEDPWLVLSEAAASRDARQREQKLNATTLSAPRAPVLKASERAALLSQGIVSAGDVLRNRSQLHHALSYAMVRELIQWAESCGAEAVVDTILPLDAEELRAGDEALRVEVARLMSEMRRGEALLQNTHDEILAARRDAARRFAKAE